MPQRPLTAVHAVGTYTGALRRAIVAYKYRGDLRWAKAFGLALSAFLKRHATWFEEFSVVCPVPAFAGAGAHRQWGHVELMCQELGWSAGSQWPVEQLLAKATETEPMSGKGRPARRQIGRLLAGSGFVVPPGTDVRGARAVLIDDVCAFGRDPALRRRRLAASGRRGGNRPGPGAGTLADGPDRARRGQRTYVSRPRASLMSVGCPIT